MPPFRFGQKGGQKLVRGNLFVKIPLKDVGVDNWALFYAFSSEVSEKPGFRNN